MSASDPLSILSRLVAWHRRALHRLLISTSAEEAQANRLVLLAWLGLTGFPFYYWVWSELYPQAYENLTLRLLGVAATMPFFCARRLQHEKWFDAYFFATITYIFPFFFTFMFLMNNGSQAWAESLLIAVIVLFHFEIKFALPSFVIGAGFAFFAYSFFETGQAKPYSELLYNLPIIGFAIISTSVVRIGRGLLMDEKLRGMASALGTVAHELRTPLRSVDANARGLKRYMPALTAVYREHQAASDEAAIDGARIAMLEPALDRIQADVQYMNSAIDLLLANASHSRQKAESREVFLMKEMLSTALARYPFEDEHQRALVQLEVRADFAASGNRDLFMMVMFNLLKNALRAIARAGKGSIVITADLADGAGVVTVRDTGCGIPASEVSLVFRRFYSYPPNAGTGIGLAFCRETLAIWGATIECRSEQGAFAEFTMRFPQQQPA